MEQPVLINFWATWCVPCRDEMPAIQRAYVQHQANRLVVLAVDDDEDQSLIVRFGRDYGLTFNLLLDPGDRVNNLSRIRAIPTSYFVDKGGVIRSMQIGSMTEAQIAYHLSKIIP
jgi:thiol-disulfide isomerase/thioredoxin